MTCPACDDSGEVVSDAFGHHEPWATYVAEVHEYCRKRGLPERVSSMLHASPCPICMKPASVAGSLAGAEEERTESAPGLEDDGFRLAG